MVDLYLAILSDETIYVTYARAEYTNTLTTQDTNANHLDETIATLRTQP